MPEWAPRPFESTFVTGPAEQDSGMRQRALFLLLILAYVVWLISSSNNATGF